VNNRVVTGDLEQPIAEPDKAAVRSMRGNGSKNQRLADSVAGSCGFLSETGLAREQPGIRITAYRRQPRRPDQAGRHKASSTIPAAGAARLVPAEHSPTPPMITMHERLEREITPVEGPASRSGRQQRTADSRPTSPQTKGQRAGCRPRLSPPARTVGRHGQSRG